MEDLGESLHRLEHDLGLPDGFCLELNEEDDWSFVIKLHALIECAVADQITRAFERKELADVFSRAELSNTKTGKLAFIKALNLLPAAHIQFIRSLSELRNALVHRVQNVTANLVDYFKAETANHAPKDLRKFADRWAFGVRVAGEEYSSDPVARFHLNISASGKIPDGVVLDRAQIFLAKPKEAIWFTALTVLDAISLCNRYGPQIWPFLMECDDKKELEEVIHEFFERAKLGDPGLPERLVHRLQRFNPSVRVTRDEDGQPNLESLAAAWRLERKRIFDEI